MAANSDLLKPDVLWAQTRDMIMLRVQVQPAEVRKQYFLKSVRVYVLFRNLISIYMILTWTLKASRNYLYTVYYVL